ncbi:hypothetical protein DVH05_010635 [Phytophthora capsici]|nr:hypothetical protein DVH05_010635 [Phytophthora capsici]|eukprot:jgi/Phyca11/125803/e_gw1.60.270.1
MKTTPINVFLLALVFITNTQAMTLTLYGGPTQIGKFDVDEVTQRCYNLYNCWGGPNKSATWNSVKRRTNVVFYSHPNCQTHQAVGKGTPDGSLYFSDVNFPQVVMAFMIWESGQYATNGIEDICHQDERSIINSTNVTNTI